MKPTLYRMYHLFLQLIFTILRIIFLPKFIIFLVRVKLFFLYDFWDDFDDLIFLDDKVKFGHELADIHEGGDIIEAFNFVFEVLLFGVCEIFFFDILIGIVHSPRLFLEVIPLPLFLITLPSNPLNKHLKISQEFFLLIFLIFHKL